MLFRSLLQTALLDAQELNTPLSSSIIQMQKIEENTGVSDLFGAIQKKNFTEAREKLDTLLIDDGYTGNEILERLKNIVVEEEKTVGETKTAHRLIKIAECDKMLSSASNERIQLENLIANFEK